MVFFKAIKDRLLSFLGLCFLLRLNRLLNRFDRDIHVRDRLRAYRREVLRNGNSKVTNRIDLCLNFNLALIINHFLAILTECLVLLADLLVWLCRRKHGCACLHHDVLRNIVNLFEVLFFNVWLLLNFVRLGQVLGQEVSALVWLISLGAESILSR